nr:hypothetical protein [Kutzneria buriramensis]WKX15985.1 hypothetical protein Q4V64_54315 [Kutzneria buriramensis]
MPLLAGRASTHVDLARVQVGEQWRELDGELLPSPFTPTGERPEGPAWYATPTVAYAVELGYDVAPLQAWVRPESGRFLDGWYKRLRDAYVATMADLGVAEKLPPHEFLTAMDGYKQRDQEMAIVVDAVKMTVKGGIGKLREKARGGGWKPKTPGPHWPVRPGGRTSAPPSSPGPASTCTARCSIWRLHGAVSGRGPVQVRRVRIRRPQPPGRPALRQQRQDRAGLVPAGGVRRGSSAKHPSVLWGADVLEQLDADGKTANLAATSRPARSPPRTPEKSGDVYGDRNSRGRTDKAVQGQRCTRPVRVGRGADALPGPAASAQYPARGRGCSASASAPSSGM